MTIKLDEPRGRRRSVPGGGSETRKDNTWTLKEQAFCVCGAVYSAEGTYEHGIPNEERVALIRELVDKAHDQWWECYKSHQGEVGLDAIDGTV